MKTTLKALTLALVLLWTPATKAEDPEACSIVLGTIIVAFNERATDCANGGQYFDMQVQGGVTVGGSGFFLFIAETVASDNTKRLRCDLTEIYYWSTSNAPNGGRKVTLNLGHLSGPVIRDTSTVCSSPLCVSLGDSSLMQFSTLEGGVLFDLDADGVREQVRWPLANSLTAILGIDSNGNGKLDNGTETLGNYSPQAPPQGSEIENGFRALRLYDLNDDGVIDEHDPLYWDTAKPFVAWLDNNLRNGETDSGELLLIRNLFASIDLNYHPLGWRDQNGNFAPFGSTAKTHDGATRQVRDVYFR